MLKVIVPAGASPVLTWHAVSAARTVLGAAEAAPPDGAAGGAVLVQPARATAAPAVSSAATDLRDMVLLLGVGIRPWWWRVPSRQVDVGGGGTAGRRRRRTPSRRRPRAR